MRPATAKAKGAATEQLLVDWMRANGVPHAERRHLCGARDRGDIAGLPGVVIEVKSGAVLAVPQWMRELAAEIDNDNADTGAVIVRPSGRPHPDGWWAMQPLPVWWADMRRAGWVA